MAIFHLNTCYTISMNIFAIIRRSIWGILLAISIVISCLYLAIAQTFLTTDGLTTIVSKAGLAETVKNDILLPRVLQNTRGSNYSALLDDATVTAAFNETVTVEALNKKMTPAIDSIQQWLNSKEPDISFSITMSDLSDKFAASLSEKVNKKIASLPLCTSKNTLAEAESGGCRVPYLTQAAFTEKINEAIKRDTALKDNSTLTVEDMHMSADSMHLDASLPDYLNLTYATSIVAAGIALLISLWLLVKHRLAGIVTIGSAAILAGITLYIGSAVGAPIAASVSSDELVQHVVRTGSTLFSAALQKEAFLLVLGGVILALAGSIALFFVAKHRKAKQSVHLGNEEKIK